MAQEQQQQQCGYECRPSLKDHPGFNPEKDAAALREAMKGLGTNEDVIIAIVAARTLHQRLKIEEVYKDKYGRDLKEDLKSELSGDFEDVVLAMFYDKPMRDARFLYKAMAGLGTDEEALIEILSTRSNYELEKIKEAYKEKYNKDLEDAVKGDTSGHLKRFLVILIQAKRDESFDADEEMAKCEAKILFDAGEKDWGTDESKFTEIFAKRSFAQIRATCKAYEKLTGHTMAHAISKEFSGNLEDALLAIVDIAYYRPCYFAKKLYKAMHGAGTDDSTLIRIVVTRSEYEMENIKDEFKAMYKKKLYDYIKDDTSGDYRKMLLHIVGK